MIQRHDGMKKRCVFLAALLMMCSAAVCFIDNAESARREAEFRHVRVGAFDYYPAMFKDADGSIKGFYADLLSEIAARENWQIEYVYGTVAEGLERIRVRSIDMLVGVAMTEERRQYCDYSHEPVLSVWNEIYTKRSSSIRMIDDLAGKKIAIVRAERNEDVFRSLDQPLDLQCSYLELDDYARIFDAIETGRVDAGVVSNVVGAGKSSSYDVKKLEPVLEPYPVYFAVPGGRNADMLDAVNARLTEWRNDEQSLYYQSQKKWMHLPVAVIKIVPREMKYALVILGATAVVALLSIALLNLQVSLSMKKLKESERHVHVSEERLRVALEGSTDAIWDWNIKTGEAYFSPRYFTMLGYTPEEGGSSYEWWKTQVHPDDCAAAEKTLSGIFSGEQEMFTIEFRMRRKDGSWCWILSRAKVVERNEYGSVMRIAGTHVDITERKEIEKQLYENQSILQGIFNTVPIGITVVVDRVITQANQQFEKFFGYSVEELRKQNTRMLYFTVEEYDRVGKILYEDITRNGTGRIETVWKCKDGTAVNTLLSMTLIDKNDPSRGYIGAAVDITARKRIEEDLRESEGKLRSLVQASPAGIGLIDNRVLLEVNDRFCELTGYSRQELIGSNIRMIYAEQAEYDRVGRELYDDIEKKKFAMTESVWQCRDGHRFNVLITAAAYKGTSISFYMLDITERKKNEAERERLIKDLEGKNAELERFTYTVSHDLKSPLLTIKGFVGLLAQDMEENRIARAKEDMAYIDSAATKMTQLLDNLLELSRIGRISSPPEKVSLGRVITEALELVSGRIASRSTTVRVPEQTPVVCVDRQRIVEVFQNLIDNAIKYSANEKPVVEIEWRDDGQGKIRCSVKDNGMGIDRRYFAKIFNIFEKLDLSSEGTGVGLALVKRIVESHGGKIWVESEGKGFGSTFYFTLPKA